MGWSHAEPAAVITVRRSKIDGECSHSSILEWSTSGSQTLLAPLGKQGEKTRRAPITSVHGDDDSARTKARSRANKNRPQEVRTRQIASQSAHLLFLFLYTSLVRSAALVYCDVVSSFFQRGTSISGSVS